MPPFRSASLLAALACTAAVTASCTTTTAPSKGPAVNSISPSSGSTLGGTIVTILGGGFASGVSVAIGGVAATGVSVVGTTSITATTPQHASGTVDVAVSMNGGTTTLKGAFTYVAPPSGPANSPPVISALTAKGTRANEPSQFADASETINVTATVSDAETPVASLAYAWTSDSGGTFAGSGAAVTWTAPSTVAAPSLATLTLTVTETYSTIGSDGLPTTATHVVTKTVTVDLHDSAKEVGALAELFLTDFSKSSITDVDYIMRNFEVCPGNPGKADETSDVQRNRNEKIITAYTISPAAVTTGFGGTCVLQDRARKGDACAIVPVEWYSTDKATMLPEHVKGSDLVAAAYFPAMRKWALCSSDFKGIETMSGLPPNPHVWP